jgi:hypothetical protein
MYLPAIFSENTRLTPISEDARNQVPFGKAKSYLRDQSRRKMEAEGHLQRAAFLGKVHEGTGTIGIHYFQGFTSGHFLYQKR